MALNNGLRRKITKLILPDPRYDNLHILVCLGEMSPYQILEHI